MTEANKYSLEERAYRAQEERKKHILLLSVFT